MKKAKFERYFMPMLKPGRTEPVAIQVITQITMIWTFVNHSSLVSVTHPMRIKPLGNLHRAETQRRTYSGHCHDNGNTVAQVADPSPRILSEDGKESRAKCLRVDHIMVVVCTVMFECT